MNTKRMTGFWAVLATMVMVTGGCAEPSAAPTEEVCGQQQALHAMQGVSLNGTRCGGEHFSEVVLNGVYLNSMTANGVNLQGRYLNGRYLNGVSLQGTHLRSLDDGQVIEAAALVGATLNATTSQGETVILTIAAAEQDPSDAELLYISLVGPDGQNVCGPDGRGFFVSGLWDPSGARHDSADGVTFSCTDGVIAKCVRWGYKPWRVGADVHQACTRMARADYCGDGVPHTQNGTAVDVFDAQGVQVQTTTAAEGFLFEAGWGPNGAVCAAHPRYRDLDSQGRARLPSCWSRLPRCESLSEAQQHGALVANASVEAERPFCAAGSSVASR